MIRFCFCACCVNAAAGFSGVEGGFDADTPFCILALGFRGDRLRAKGVVGLVFWAVLGLLDGIETSPVTFLRNPGRVGAGPGRVATRSP
jgi:hypothetical protein